MKKMNAFVVCFFALMLFGSVASNVLAQSQSVNAVLPKEQVVNEDYFAAGDTVTISGTVNGDVYAAGGMVIIDGIVNGDLLAAGGNINVRGKVTDDARLAGGQVTVSGEIGKNITTVGGSVTIADSAKINGSLTAATGSLAVFAPIGRQATIGAGQLTLDNVINGNVKAGIGQLTVTPNAKIIGDLTYWSETDAQIDSQAQIEGTTTHNLPPQPTKEQQESLKPKQAFAALIPVLNVVNFLAALVVGLLFIKLMPVFSTATATIIQEKPLQSLGIGFISLIAAPFVFVLLLITIIGIPLDLILLAGLFTFTYLAKIVVGMVVGQKVVTAFNKKLALGWTLALGLFLYYVVTMIPLLGFVVYMFVGLIGFGALLIQLKATYIALRSNL